MCASLVRVLFLDLVYFYILVMKAKNIGQRRVNNTDIAYEVAHDWASAFASESDRSPPDPCTALLISVMVWSSAA